MDRNSPNLPPNWKKFFSHFREGKHYLVNKDTGCWEWQLKFNRDYPIYKRCAVHQLSYCIMNDDIEYVEVCHTCDNKKCINPNHLYNGLHRDNMRDTTSFTEDDALSMVIMSNSGVHKKTIAKIFGISVSTVYSVLNGTHWLTQNETYKQKISKVREV